jgi:hypothetical protein
MRAILTMALIAAAWLGSFALPGPAAAQSASETQAPDARVRTVRPRVQVTPTRRLHRECVDWYTVEQRASGPTVVPNMRCWWAGTLR